MKRGRERWRGDGKTGRRKKEGTNERMQGMNERWWESGERREKMRKRG